MKALRENLNSVSFFYSYYYLATKRFHPIHSIYYDFLKKKKKRV